MSKHSSPVSESGLLLLKKCSGIVYIDGSLLPFLHTEFELDPVRNNVAGRPTVS